MSSAFQMSSVLFKCHFLTYKKQKTYMTNKKHRFFLSFLLFFLGIMYICKIYVYTKILAKSILSNLCTKIISLIHRWLTVQFPLCQPMSYVDDWQFVTKDPSELEGIHNSLVAFTEAVDLLLDRKKTFAWTLDSATRKSLRQKGLSVRKSAKALGAQMQFSRQHVAFVIHDRIKDLQPLWSRLRNSLSPYRLKVRAIKVAAWPRGLHRISAVCLGATRFVPLRSAAMKGLSAEGSGCNPMVHLGLVEEPLVDPQYWYFVH